MATEKESAIGRFETGFFRKLQHSLFGKQILESLHMTDGKELMILHRGHTFKYRNKPIYSKETFYVPIKNITNLTLENDLNNTAVLNLKLSISSYIYNLIFLKSNQSAQTYRRLIPLLERRSRIPVK